MQSNQNETTKDNTRKRKRSKKSKEGKNERPDVKARLQEKKLNLETVVKGSLHKYIRGNECKKKVIIEEINKRVNLYSKRITKASLLINTFIRYIISKQKKSNNGNLSYITLPEYLLDQTFIRQSILGSEGCRVRFSEFENFINETGSMKDICDLERNFGDRNIYSHGSKKYIANAMNHLILNFDSFMNKYLYNISFRDYENENDFKDIVYYTRGKIHNWDKTQKVPKIIEDNPVLESKVTETVKLFRTILKCEENDVINKSWMKDNLIHILEMFVFILEKCEDYNSYFKENYDLLKLRAKNHRNKKKKANDFFIKLFHLLPVHTIKAHFISIDNDVFEGLYKDIRQYKQCEDLPILPPDWNTDSKRDTYWDMIFRIRKLEGQYHKFSNHISSDGYACDFHYKRPIVMKESFVKDLVGKLEKIREKYEKEEQEQENKIDSTENTDKSKKRKAKKSKTQEDEEKDVIKEFLEGKRILGLDPGRVTIMYIAEDTGNEIKSYKLTRCHYYRNAGIMRSRKLTETWMRKNKEFREGNKELSKHSLKTIDLEGICKSIDVYCKFWNVFWEEKLKMRWRRNNFNLYKGKQRVFSNFFNRIDEDNKEKKQTVIAYGSARFSSTAKGELAAPTSKAYKECCKRYATFLVNEFRSTIVKYKDNKRLWHIKEVIKDYKGNDRLRYKGDLRGLLWLPNQNTNKFIDRDLNGALNIRQNLLNGSFCDPIFSRDTKFEKEEDEDKFHMEKIESQESIDNRIKKIKRYKKKKSSNGKSSYQIIKCKL